MSTATTDFDGFIRWSAASLTAGGAVTAALNLAFTPFMPLDAPLVTSAASSLYLWRQSASALAAALLLLGSVGLYLRQAGRLGRFGTLAFLCAFFGSALLLAWEWADVFVLRPLAIRAPEGLEALERGDGLDLYDLGALVPVTLFALGWLWFAALTVRAGTALRAGAWIVIVALFITPIFTAVLGLWGAGLGNAVLGAGWMWLGVETWKGEGISSDSVLLTTRSS